MRHVITSKALLAAPLLAALALGACKKEPQSQAEVKQEIAALPKPKPGLYRVETKLVTFDMPGMPAQAQAQIKQVFAAQTGREVCVSKAEADEGYEGMTKKLAEGNCSFDTFDLSGSSLDAKLTCVTGKETKAEVLIKGDVSAEGSKMTTTVQQAGGKIVTESTMARTADCPAA